MSELYVALRSRIWEVANWVYLDADTMREARERQGLSYEAVAKSLPVVGKTVERWEKQGRVPRDLLVQYATVVGLTVEAETLAPLPVEVGPGPVGTGERLDAVEARLGEIEAGQRQLQSLVRDVLDELRVPGAAIR